MAPVEPKITLGLCNGQTVDFVMANLEALESRLTPEAQDQLFEPPIFLLANGIITSGTRTSAIAWLRVHQDIPLSWKYPFEADAVEVIPEAKFNDAMEIKRVHTKIAITSAPEGTPIEVYTRIQSGDGVFHHFRVKTHTLTKCYRLSIPERICGMHVYHAKHPDGGWLIINLKNFLRWEVYPGVVDFPDCVWPLLRFA